MLFFVLLETKDKTRVPSRACVCSAGDLCDAPEERASNRVPREMTAECVLSPAPPRVRVCYSAINSSQKRKRKTTTDTTFSDKPPFFWGGGSGKVGKVRRDWAHLNPETRVKSKISQSPLSALMTGQPSSSSLLRFCLFLDQVFVLFLFGKSYINHLISQQNIVLYVKFFT